MTRPFRNALLAPFAMIGLAACALRLGGPSPEDYDAAAIAVAGGADAAAVAAQIRSDGMDIVLLSAAPDTAWFARVAEAAQLTLSGPGTTSGRGLAFLTNLEILGDTSLVLEVEGGGAVHMHDALYQVDEDRHIDLMMVRFEGADIRAGVRRLLGYIATDVGASAALLLAIDAPTAPAADSAAILVRATLGNAAECGEIEREAPAAPIRLLYGPSARLTCESARQLPNGIFARVQVQR